MALYKLSKPKTFHVQYCGCTAASFLLNEQAIRDAIGFIRQIKGKQQHVRTDVVVSSEGVRITYENEQRFSTLVPSMMIAASAVGRPPYNDTVGVVYISPLTGDHYPAFIHTYRCDASRTAEKLFSRLQAYLLIESHRLGLIQLEQDLLDRNLLNINAFNAKKSQISNGKKSNPSQPVLPPASNSSLSSNSSSDEQLLEKRNDPMKSITEEFQRKINSNVPILFPPKDYDTIHAAHGNIYRAQAWKSTEPAIVGYAPIHTDENRSRPQLANSMPIGTTHNGKINGDLKNNDRLRLTSQRSDVTADPVETVSLAFDFLKDETGSIAPEPEPPIEPVPKPTNNSPIYRFRPAQTPANVPNKKWHDRNHQHVEQKHRARSETRLLDDYPSSGTPMNHIRYGNGAPISHNPLWTGQSPNLAGSQPNLLSPSTPFYHQRSSSQHPMYSSHIIERSPPSRLHQSAAAANPGKQRQGPPPGQINRKQNAQTQYFDTNEFILRPSNDQPYPNRYSSSALLQEPRPRSMNTNGNHAAMLDVYY